MLDRVGYTFLGAVGLLGIWAIIMLLVTLADWVTTIVSPGLLFGGALFVFGSYLLGLFVEYVLDA